MQSTLLDMYCLVAAVGLVVVGILLQGFLLDTFLQEEAVDTMAVDIHLLLLQAVVEEAGILRRNPEEGDVMEVDKDDQAVRIRTDQDNKTFGKSIGKRAMSSKVLRQSINARKRWLSC